MPPRLLPAARRPVTPELLSLVAGRFRALAEPVRLAILHELEDGELTVTELVERIEMSQGNLSKHLQQLHAAGFVTRRREGLFVHYALADERVLALCELMCGRLEEDLGKAQRVVSGRRNARTGAASTSPASIGSASSSQAPGTTPRKSRFSSTKAPPSKSA
jgi:DNA-binding transcriptional ArsR family regulator